MISEVTPTILDGVSTFRVEGEFSGHSRLLERLQDTCLNLGTLFPPAVTMQAAKPLSINSYIQHKQDRQIEHKQRDPWSHDFMFHIDGTTLPEDDQPDATLVIGRFAENGAPPTTIVCASKLLELVQSDGLLDDIDVEAVQAVFADSTYYDQAQPFFLEWFRSSDDPAAKETADKLAAIMANDVQAYGTTTREEFIAKRNQEHPPRAVDFIVKHTVTGADALYFDGCVRNRNLVSDVIDQAVLDQLLRTLRWDYLGNLKRLIGEGCAIQIHPQTGVGMAFVQKGTIHKAEPGYERTRLTSVIGLTFS